jgi:hypothetical protein
VSFVVQAFAVQQPPGHEGSQRKHVVACALSQRRKHCNILQDSDVSHVYLAQLSLTHTQLKVGTPTSVTPLTSSESSQHNPKIEKGTNKWQKQEQ